MATTAKPPSQTTRTRIQTAGGITRWVSAPVKPASEPLSLRSEMGDVLREHRTNQGLTLREMSAKALVSLGYLSEIERGKKEASSEILEDLCVALGISLARLLREVAERLDPTPVPDTIEGIESALQKEATTWAT